MVRESHVASGQQEHCHGGETNLQFAISWMCYTSPIDAAEYLCRNVNSQLVTVRWTLDAQFHQCLNHAEQAFHIGMN
jgi:hypothetical protein